MSEKKKVISVMIPTYNEEENARPIYEAVRDEIRKDCPDYDYEILFIDNKSQDRTRRIITDICAQDPKVKAIFNSKNFGQFNSPYYGMIHTTGDCTITICADFQDPVEMIPKLLAEWENGYKIVCAVKTSSKENRLMYALRSLYYKMIKKASKVEQIEHFTGFGLYDKSFVKVLRELDDPTPFIRGIVAELGPKIKKIEYEQAKRRAGKTSNNFFSLYDAAMLSFTSYTKIGVRLASFLGVLMSGKNPIVKAILRVYLEIIRIMPQMVLLFLVFFGTTRAWGWDLSGETASVIVFVLWGTAEMSDLVRGALISIPKHQYESSEALGLTKAQTYWYIIIPQTVRRLIPLSINLITRMIKTTSLVLMIGVVEVLKVAQQIIEANRMASPNAAFGIYLVVFLLYFLACWPISLLASYLEKKWR